MGQNQVVGQHQATLKKFLLLERTKFLNPFRKQPPTNPLQSKSTRAISYAYGMIVIRLSVRERRLELLVEESELERRRPLMANKSTSSPARGYSWLYDTFITQANEGCDFAFLKKNGPKPDQYR